MHGGISSIQSSYVSTVLQLQKSLLRVIRRVNSHVHISWNCPEQFSMVTYSWKQFSLYTGNCLSNRRKETVGTYVLRSLLLLLSGCYCWSCCCCCCCCTSIVRGFAQRIFTKHWTFALTKVGKTVKALLFDADTKLVLQENGTSRARDMGVILLSLRVTARESRDIFLLYPYPPPVYSHWTLSGDVLDRSRISVVAF